MSSWSTFVLNFFLSILVMLECMSWYFITVLICISLAPNDVEHLLTCLLTIHVFSLVIGLLKYFCTLPSCLLAGLPFYYWLVGV